MTTKKFESCAGGKDAARVGLKLFYNFSQKNSWQSFTRSGSPRKFRRSWLLITLSVNPKHFFNTQSIFFTINRNISTVKVDNAHCFTAVGIDEP